MIFSVDAYFEKPVMIIGGGWGLTDYYLTWAVADRPELAEALALEWFAAKDLPVKRVRAKEALEQDEGKYVFPESFIRSSQPPAPHH